MDLPRAGIAGILTPCLIYQYAAAGLSMTCWPIFGGVGYSRTRNLLVDMSGAKWQPAHFFENGTGPSAIMAGLVDEVNGDRPVRFVRTDIVNTEADINADPEHADGAAMTIHATQRISRTPFHLDKSVYAWGGPTPVCARNPREGPRFSRKVELRQRTYVKRGSQPGSDRRFLILYQSARSLISSNAAARALLPPALINAASIRRASSSPTASFSRTWAASSGSPC